jgi:hypothetical protein
MAIVSEDRGVGSGFWHGAVYQVHRPQAVTRELQTKAGPLPLEGVLEVWATRASFAEIRKGVGQASVQHPRLSVKRKDASGCEAVLIPLVQEADGTLCEDFSRPPELVPLALLGCKVEVEPIAAGDCRTGGTFRMGAPVDGYGGARLHGMVLSGGMFAAAEMVAGGDVDFEAMKVAQLKAELAVLDADGSEGGAAATAACIDRTGGERAPGE